jgi:hypothetical protein
MKTNGKKRWLMAALKTYVNNFTILKKLISFSFGVDIGFS